MAHHARNRVYQFLRAFFVKRQFWNIAPPCRERVKLTDKPLPVS